MDALGAYLADIGKIPLLTAEEEIVLARDVQNGLTVELETPPGERDRAQKRTVRRGHKSKQRMIEANLRLVVSVAKKYKRFGMEMMDLIQEGSIGLHRAVEKFDPERGYKFSTYAYWWIRQAMTRALDTQSRSIRVPLHLSEIHVKIRRCTRDIERDQGRKPTYEELAEYTGRSVEQIREVITAFIPITSLDLKTNADGDHSGKTTIVDLISDPNQHPPDEMDLEDHAALNERYLSQLSPREREVVELCFGLTCQEEMTLSQIGKQIINADTGQSISRERVRQLRDNALQKMRYWAAAIEPLRQNTPISKSTMQKVIKSSNTLQAELPTCA